MLRHINILLLICIVGSISILQSCNHDASAISEQLPDTISYNFNIRPILSDKCYKCHGPDGGKRQAGLRLDMPESAFKALKDNPEEFEKKYGKGAKWEDAALFINNKTN